MGVQTILKEVKAIHGEYVVLVKNGNFYNSYGKDAGIVANLCNYNIKEKEGIIICGFPKSFINKIIGKLEVKKINYLILNKNDDYSLEQKVDFKNLNTYNQTYQNSKVYVQNKILINKMNEYFNNNIKSKELNEKLKKMEEIINGTRKV